MNSVLDYIRQLNQQSMTLPDEWLDRLRIVEMDSEERALTPEIILTKDSDIRTGGPANSDPPLTMVNQQVPQTENAVAQADPIELSLESTSTTVDAGAGSGFLQPVDAGQNLELLLDDVVQSSAGHDISDDDTVTYDDSGILPPDQHFEGQKSDSDISHRIDPPDLQPFDPFAGIPSSSDIITTLKNSEPNQEQIARDPGPPEPMEQLVLETGIQIADNQSVDDDRGDELETGDRLAAQRTPCIVDAGLAKRFDYRRCASPKSIDRVVGKMLERFPVVTSSTVMLVAAEPGIDVDGVAARIATCLANREVGGILLVDGNTGSRQLSSVMGTDRNPGLTEMINRSNTLSGTACPTDNSNLEFLPCGSGEITNRKLDAARSATLTRELNQSFQYTIISGGQPGDTLVRSWSEFVDAVYLLVDLDSADRDRTCRLVEAFRTRGVRVAGCIAVQS